MTLRRRRIDVTFQLGPTTSASDPTVTTNPTFAEGGNTVTLQNHRASATIKQAGAASMAEAQVRIYGMTPSLMNQLSTLGRVRLAQARNTISVSAGNDEDGMAVVFQGTITTAWADFKSAPEVPFHVLAQSGMAAALTIVPAASFTGAADVATLMSGFATQMGFAFENNGVTARLASPYFPGALLRQAQSCAQAAGIDMVIENNVLAIMPRGVARGGQIPLLSPSTGMVGYPSFTGNGIGVQCEYNPNVTFHGLIQVESDLPPANGRWRIINLLHDISAETPGGPWFSFMECTEPQYAPVR